MSRPPSRRFRGLIAALAAATLALIGTAPPAAADEVRDQQWHLGSLDVAEAHQTTRGQGVTVAVIDTGVDPDHPDLAGNVLRGYDIDTGGDGRTDKHGHGTRMANLVAGHGHGPGNGDGVLGIAPEAKILPVSIGTEARATPSQIAEGVRWAADNGAQVINMSIRGVGDDTELQPAIAYAQTKDAVVVSGAGNSFDGDYVVGPPASYPGVIGVSAVNQSGRFAPGVSVEGPEVGLAAPGRDLSTSDARGHAISKGTSGATAIVSGVAALVRARYPELDAVNVINRMVATADDKGPSGRDPRYGFGVVNPVGALTADVPRVEENPLGSLAQPPETPTRNPAQPSPGGAGSGADDGGGGGLLPILLVGAAVLGLALVALSVVFAMRGRRPATAPSRGGPTTGPYPPPQGPPPQGPSPQGPPGSSQGPSHWPPSGQPPAPPPR